MNPPKWIKRLLLCHTVLFALAGCATAPSTALPSATPTNISPATCQTSPSTIVPSVTPMNVNPTTRLTPGKPTGKLSARLELLANSPSLRAASAEEQAGALSLPTQGAGSLMRDEQGRLQVNIRMADTLETQLQALRAAGAVITNVSERYHTVTAFVAPADLSAIANLAAVESVEEELSPAHGGGAVVPPPP